MNGRRTDSIKERKMAVLIDADNVSDKYIKSVIDEVSTYGTPTVKRIYGDWTSPRNAKWKTVLLNYSIIPIQQYNYTTGKNSTDSSLIIDAMDLLYSKDLDGFCIVSSDSDFTRLAARLREAGMFVLGMGEKKTAQPFIAACEKFTYLEVITTDDSDVTKKIKKQPEGTNILPKAKLCSQIKQIINEISDEDGWAFMGDLGNMLIKRNPSFDTRNYGFSKLTPLVESTKLFDIRSDSTNNRGVTHKYVRIKGDPHEN